ncbi:multidrug resistance protein Stp [Gordonia polyisoprenivorans VH2]|uniref:Multidrug resistance protein Stp n=1 Tax=Gordonia polyisoprenivorans (strain DSM 44266 / VH2) TaxID=1112204 RepID=H6MRX7_GORPV|nr:MFS transporter [Gordonia polyisoprenivorans]AFA73783.1 multidrug resistance protein Stp [Gordonia polyisoprenivorans VH2]OZC30921.1 MFS transporter [Gordonia polyisoprenivorans]UZF54196.1 MFS transporter [Gordonia polyisoprenivorans]
MTQRTLVTGQVADRYVLDRRTLIAAAAAIALAQAALAMPAVLNGLFQDDLGTSASQLTWISAAFLVPVTLFELTFGVLGDLFGRKRLLIIGTIVLGIGQLIGFLTPGAEVDTSIRVAVLLVGQVLTGVGAAAIMPTTLAMVAAGTHTPHDRARAISVWAAALATGSFVSPVLGGFLARYPFAGTDTAGWRWGFLAVAVLAVPCLIVTLTMATTSSAPTGRSLDWPGQITVAISLFALLYAVIQGSTTGYGAPDIIGAFVLAALSAVAFIIVERRASAPLLRLDLFGNRAFSVAAIATVLGSFALLGTAYITSIRLAAIQGFSPLVTSIAFVILNGMTLLTAPLVARLLVRHNARWLMAGGFGLIAIGDLWAASIPAATMSLGLILPPIAVVGLGFALALQAVTAVAVNTVPTHLAGMASGTTSLLRDFGFTLGPSVIGAIALTQAANAIEAKLNASEDLRNALQAFDSAPAHASGATRESLEAAVGAVHSGPLGANGVPATVMVDGKSMPLNPLQSVAFDALDHSYSMAFVVCAGAALLATLIVGIGFTGVDPRGRVSGEPETV